MSVVRTLWFAIAGAFCGFLAIDPAFADSAGTPAIQQASLSAIKPSAQDYIGVPTPAPPVKPTDPVKLAVFKVFETHCSRCHETERLVGRTKPAKGFGNILHVDEVAANPKYIVPGDLNHSTLYWQVKHGDMPNDLSDGDYKLATTPTEADLKVIRDWIAELGEKPQAVASLAPVPPPAAPSTRADVPLASSDMATVKPSPIVAEPVPVSAPLIPAEAAKTPIPDRPVTLASLNQDQSAALPPKALDQGPDLNFGVTSPIDHVLVAKAQDQLKKLGCYEGEINGREDSQTDAALSRYNAKQGRGTAVAALSSDLLEELMSQIGRICSPLCPPGQIVDGSQCVPDPDAAPLERRRAPANVGENDDQPSRHKHHPQAASPAEIAHGSRQGEAPSQRQAQEPSHRQERQAQTPSARHERQAQQPSRSRRVARSEPQPNRAIRQASQPPSAAAPRSSASASISGVNGI